MAKRKEFVAEEAVEVIPEPVGRRKARETDWKPATYRHRGKYEMEGWHFVTYGSSVIHVPTQRIRKAVR